MKTLVLILIVTLTLTGCSAIASKAVDALTGNDDGLSVDVDANAGRSEATGDEGTAQNANTAVALQGGRTSRVYEGPIEAIHNSYGLTWWQLLLFALLAGWAIPSPSEMLRGLVHALRSPFKH